MDTQAGCGAPRPYQSSSLSLSNFFKAPRDNKGSVFIGRGELEKVPGALLEYLFEDCRSLIVGIRKGKLGKPNFFFLLQLMAWQSDRQLWLPFCCQSQKRSC